MTCVNNVIISKMMFQILNCRHLQSSLHANQTKLEENMEKCIENTPKLYKTGEKGKIVKI